VADEAVLNIVQKEKNPKKYPFLDIYKLMGYGRALSPCAARPPPIAALLILSAKFMINDENPSKKPSLGENPRKCYSFFYTHIVQKCNCRWHCEFKCFFGYAYTKNNPFTLYISNLSPF
jgi:hypothetical protein